MKSIQVLEYVSRVTPLGVRFRDVATGATIAMDLSVVVYPRLEPELRTRAVVNRAGVFVFCNLPGLHEAETGAGDAGFWATYSPPQYEFVLEVRDPARRFHPFVLPVKLPQRGILGLGVASPLTSPPLGQIGSRGAFVPLFSTPSRGRPEGMAVLRAEMLDSGTDEPAAWAVIEARSGGQPVVTGVADERGRIMLPLPYPKAVITLGSLSTPNTPLTDQTWSVDFTVRYRRRAPVPSMPDLYDVLTQPVATAWRETTFVTPLTQGTLRFGRELVLATQTGTGDSTAMLLVTPMGSPP